MPDPATLSQADGFTDGGPGGEVEGYVNVPINDKVAIRLVAFDEHDGGYIDNVLKTRVFNLTPGSDPATGRHPDREQQPGSSRTTSTPSTPTAAARC